jgi:non-ribosomal peptide synthetase-like protein
MKSPQDPDLLITPAGKADKEIHHEISVLAILLGRYSGYLADTVSLQISSAGSHELSALFRFSLPWEQSFTTFSNKVRAQLEEIPWIKNAVDLLVEWKTEHEEGGDYRILLSGAGVNSASFNCSPKSMLRDVFKSSARYFSVLFNSSVNDPSVPLRDLEYLQNEDKDNITGMASGRVDEDISKDDCLHHIFEATAKLFPRAVAIRDGDLNITYEELDRLSDQLANHLVQKGVVPGDFVGIHLKRSPCVYASMLAILKAGAAYVPLDPGYPEDRVTYILRDASINLLISQSALQDSHINFDKEVIYVEGLSHDVFKGNALNPATAVAFNSPAYIIYTSGSTGRPKGVLIPHHAVCNLVKAERKVFALNHTEKVAQGFSVAFDASIEEIWLAFASGAALYPVSEEIMHSSADLCSFIRQNNISVLSTVPTMLSMMETKLESLKLLILGGENCPGELLEKWKRPELRIVNSYGPTEATVIATYADFIPGKKISLGRPLINYCVFITDQFQKPLPPGIPGELCIGGKSLALGYLNRDELTKEKFIEPGFTLPAGFPHRIYRSGDLARFNEEGEIEFLGRIDSQVKLRGYRIELSEIESQLLQLGEIENAAVAVKEDGNKVQHLIAYLVLKNGSFDESACRDFLKSRLAAYMVPARFVIMEKFPVLPSGKTDRKKLPMPELSAGGNTRKIILPQDPVQSAIYESWRKYFPPQDISVTDDFFDLGGHSLLASLVISDLRKIPGFEKISVQDIYSFRTIEKLAQHLEQSAHIGSTQKQRAAATQKVPGSVFAAVTFLQSASFFLFMLVGSAGLLSPFILEQVYPGIGTYHLITLSSLMMILSFPALLIASIAVKWLVIGKFREGRYPLWGFYYFRFWFVKKFVDLTPLGLLSGTPFLNFYFRLMGAKIGKNVYLGSDRIRIFDLCQVGDNSSIMREAHLTGYTVENGELIIGPLSIGKNCVIGTRSVISEYAVMNDHSTLGDLSLLQAGQGIPEGENWEGSPAAKTGHSKYDRLFTTDRKKGLPYFFYLFVQFAAILLLMFFPLALMVPFSLTFYEIDFNYGFGATLLIAVPCAAVYVFLFCVFVAMVKWLITGRLKEGAFSIYSFRYVQKWTVDMILHFVLLSFKSIYATVYLPSWLRLMGAKVGRRAEISTVNQISTDLLEVGEESFLADSVSIGSPDVKNGIMFLKKTSVGSKTFIGNSAVLACGDSVGNESLIGVLSVPPKKPTPQQENGASWLGSPSIYLPNRQPSQQFDATLTFNPTTSLIFKRGAIEFFKITLPMAITISLLAIFYKLIYDVLLIESLSIVVLLAPFLLFSLMLFTPLITVAFKKLLIGKYKPGNKPLWSVFVWKNELVNSLCESMVYPLLVNLFLGTPYAPFFFRMMGCKIGKKVFMETTEITEFDLVHIGDEACLNQLCTIQTHLFEDRVMKMSDLHVGNNCTLGAMAVVLYDSEMKDGSSIDALSLVMKGETIPENSRWAGSPVKYIHG